ncbi:Uncharacterized protein HZ326_22624, partial [Fusarium oxysporum f. sp. albedinis]
MARAFFSLTFVSKSSSGYQEILSLRCTKSCSRMRSRSGKGCFGGKRGNSLCRD